MIQSWSLHPSDILLLFKYIQKFKYKSINNLKIEVSMLGEGTKEELEGKVM